MSDWVKNTRSFCPVCGKRGAAQGIQNVGKWMQCSNDHEWGYEEAGEKA